MVEFIVANKKKLILWGIAFLLLWIAYKIYCNWAFYNGQEQYISTVATNNNDGYIAGISYKKPRPMYVDLHLNMTEAFEKHSTKEKFLYLKKIQEQWSHHTYKLRDTYGDVAYSHDVHATTSSQTYTFDGLGGGYLKIGDNIIFTYLDIENEHKSTVEIACSNEGDGTGNYICEKNVEAKLCGHLMNRGLAYSAKLDECLATIHKRK